MVKRLDKRDNGDYNCMYNQENGDFRFKGVLIMVENARIRELYKAVLFGDIPSGGLLCFVSTDNTDRYRVGSLTVCFNTFM